MRSTVDIVTPAAGESVTEGTVLGWTVAVGDLGKSAPATYEWSRSSTDKVDVELPCPRIRDDRGAARFGG